MAALGLNGNGAVLWGNQTNDLDPESKRYRTILWRIHDPAIPPLVFLMLNPSTADASNDDPTIRRCRGFAQREGAGGIVVINLSPFRATDPKDLNATRMVTDVDFMIPRGPQEDAFKTAAATNGRLVCAWGANYQPWMKWSIGLAQMTFGHAYCLGLTKSGHPRHPLMLPSSAPLERFYWPRLPAG